MGSASLTEPTGVVWRRSARARRVGLRIDARLGAVVVTLPARVSRGAGRRFLMSQADWVSERLAALPAAVALVDGAAVSLDGAVFRIRHRCGLASGVSVLGGDLVVGGDPACVAAQVGAFLRDEARRRLTDRVAVKAGIAGVVPRRVVVKDTTTRWGSCAKDGSLAFSWRLVMAPGYVQDYVTGHEVAHLRHMNHGDMFWRLVEALTPYRDAAVNWLAVAGPGLLRVG